MLLRRMLLLGLVALPLLPARAGADSADTASVQGLYWDWQATPTRRYYVESSVQLPGLLLVKANENVDARLVSFRTRLVMACSAVDTEGRRSVELACKIEDFSMRGVPARGDQGILAPILDEIDQKVTGSSIQWIQRNDGRILNIDIEGVPKRNRREARTHEAIRLILARTIAPFDIELPRKGSLDGAVWGQYGSTLFAAPADSGSAGTAEIAHLIRSVDDGYAIVESAGKGMMTPSSDGTAKNFFDMKLDSFAVFDTNEHMLQERIWNCRGRPTASSAVAEGSSGVDYLQVGKLLYLAPGVDAPDLGLTEEVPPRTENGDSAIFNWTPLNSAGPP